MLMALLRVINMNLVRNRNTVFICIYCITTQVACLTILEHSIEPPVVRNCSSVRMTCRVDESASDVDVWWTFRGNNVSKLPGVVISADEGVWLLELECPTLHFNGIYTCNARERNASEVVYKKRALLNIYVPVVIELENNVTALTIGRNVDLACLVTSDPRAEMKWFKDGELLDFSTGRSKISTQVINLVTYKTSLHLENLERQDNGIYSCQATTEFSDAIADQRLMVEEPPEVEFLRDNITITNASDITLYWHVTYNGNLNVQQFRLTQENVLEKSIVETDIPGNITKYTVTSLKTGVNYTFGISAQNNAGVSSDYDYYNVTMPPSVPPKVPWVRILASTEESLLFGFGKPSYDNGAIITHFNVQLSHSDKSVLSKFMPVNIERKNHMYIFLNLDSGKTYDFQVQACNVHGCGIWSDSLEAATRKKEE